MKIGGVDPKTILNEVLLVLPRGETNIVFRAVGLKDMTEFDAQCPMPKPPGRQETDGSTTPMDNDPTYKQVLEVWSKRRLGYMAYHSLKPSAIEWDLVKEGDPRTWLQWEKDLKDGGLSDVEFNRVLGLVLEANSLDETKLAKARELFVRGQALMSPPSSGQPTEPANTPSGEPVEE